MKSNKHIIKSIIKNSPLDNKNINVGDVLLSINGKPVEDIFDYQYLTEDDDIIFVFQTPTNEQYSVRIIKDPDADPGLVFDNGLMDAYKSCTNKCIFCFIDQMPPGMRDTLYFKDDDSRLSFLQGNYVTLTNMSDHDVERICEYHLSPINISFQTTNPQLRCKMLNNRFAGDALEKVNRLFEAGIVMNGQIVLCKGVNDGEELERSIEDLSKYLPYLQSVSVVPVGLSKYREGLFQLEPFNKEDAVKTLDIIHKWQNKLYPEYGLHFIHASDEWYILAEMDLPKEDSYDGYLQLENGVGMVRLLLDEFYDGLSRVRFIRRPKEELSIATGHLMYPFISKMCKDVEKIWPGLKIHVYDIANDFFGNMITVSGLITAQDIGAQLGGRKSLDYLIDCSKKYSNRCPIDNKPLHITNNVMPLGKRLLIPENMLRSGENYFLDDITIDELSNALQVDVQIVKSSGYDLVEAFASSGIRFGKKLR